MKVHHLNCGSMKPPGSELVCHVLLCESEGGLVLIDTGFGTADIAQPSKRLSSVRFLLRAKLDPSETAIAQIKALGHKPEDVRHILITHFDFDHIGGLSDFPNAHIHTSAAGALGAIHSP